MANQDPDGPRFPTDAAFDRWLLDSAKLDAPSQRATERAWGQFTQSLGAVSPVEPPRLGSGEGSGAVGTAALKWLAVGALGGALITATWMSGPGRGVPPSQTEATAAPAAPPAGVETPLSSTPLAPAPGFAAREPAASSSAPQSGSRDRLGAASIEDAVAPARKSVRSAPSATTPRVHRPAESSIRSRRAGDATTLTLESDVPAAQHEEPPSSAGSTLEREIALLDAVRNALTADDFNEALSLIARYRHQFERGELARDADVFEIEAFAGSGDRARAARAAQTFRRLYPRDPHSARLQGLAELAPD